MTLPLELGAISDPTVRQPLEQIGQRFPLEASTTNFAQFPQVRVFHSGTVVIATGVVTVLGTTGATTAMFDSERWDLGTPGFNMHSTATTPGRLICRTPGLYQINGYCSWTLSAAGGRQIRIRVNGTDRATLTAPVAAAAFGGELSVSGEYRLAVNDFVELVVFQNSGGNLDLAAELGMYWVSP